MLQRHEEVLVCQLHLFVPRRLQPGLLDKSLALVDRVVQLSVRVADLAAAHEELEPLDEIRVLGFRFASGDSSTG